jgi:tRNA pseudouridine55 synthase
VQFKRIKRPIDGVLLLDKSLGLSSNQALQQVKHLYQASKAGHTGSLDPLASGLLPICFGEATKFSHFLLNADKSYSAVIKLGSTTSTGDAEGEVLTTARVDVKPVALETVLNQFIGEILQVPPMYSALKHEGKALYEYARAGVNIERPARAVTIHKIDLKHFDGEQLEIVVACSKGTYIRTLAEDIGNALGCGAHLAGLRRLTTAQFGIDKAWSLERLEAIAIDQRDQILLPVDAILESLPQVQVDEISTHYLLQGQPVWKSGLNMTGFFRLYTERGNFLGIGQQAPDGKIAPKRLLVAKPE